MPIANPIFNFYTLSSPTNTNFKHKILASENIRILTKLEQSVEYGLYDTHVHIS